MVRKILRLPAVLDARGRSRSSHYCDIAQGLYTRPIKIGLRAAGWPDNEVAILNDAYIAGMSGDDLRALVRKLEAERKVIVRRPS